MGQYNGVFGILVFAAFLTIIGVVDTVRSRRQARK